MSTHARPALSVGIPTFGTPAARHGHDWRHLLEVARMAEDAGVDRLVVSDHVVLGPGTDAYPWGRFPTGPEADWLEPLTVVTALAAVTTTVGSSPRSWWRPSARPPCSPRPRPPSTC
ncbi:MAG: LLM class flavin-dependent oxidoreductase [Acidimicrobiales bacterium]